MCDPNSALESVITECAGLTLTPWTQENRRLFKTSKLCLVTGHGSELADQTRLSESRGSNPRLRGLPPHLQPRSRRQPPRREGGPTPPSPWIRPAPGLAASPCQPSGTSASCGPQSPTQDFDLLAGLPGLPRCPMFKRHRPDRVLHGSRVVFTMSPLKGLHYPCATDEEMFTVPKQSAPGQNQTRRALQSSSDTKSVHSRVM